MSTPPKKGDYTRIFEGLLRRIQRYNKTADIPLLRKAFDVSFAAHLHQTRKSGDPYFVHPLEVVKILVGLKMDYQTIAAGLLHDTVEDTEIKLDDIRREFGDHVALLVDGVTKISSLKLSGNAAQQSENFKKMLLSMVKDIRVIMIKFGDRLHNMRTLNSMPIEKQRRIALETQQVYAPLAHRLGLSKIKSELEDLALKVLDPDVFNDLVAKVTESKDERDEAIILITKPIREKMIKEKILARFEGRAKHYSSIYNKIVNRGVPFEEIADLLAIRIIVGSVRDCYHALGIVHDLHRPIDGHFKDYIALPKTNGYQSIHTTVIGPLGRKYEIQIRTEEMHRTAEDGIAAHWRYKEGKIREDDLDKQLAWLRQVLESDDELDPDGFMSHLQVNLFQDEIFVYTPRGDLYKLPINATPVDFAFAVHTDIGLHCHTARVNGRIQTLNYKLKSGDVVEIQTSANKFPNEDWLKFVATSKARGKIKRFLRDAEFESSVALGSEMLTRALNRYSLKLKDVNLAELAEKLKFGTEHQLLASIGQGDTKLETIIRRLVPEEKQVEKEKSKIAKFFERPKGGQTGIRVAGIDNIMINFAKCCSPVPGEPITGIITRGRGIIVHANTCRNLLSLIQQPERIIDVSWGSMKNSKFIASLYILGERRKNVIAEISEVVNAADSSIVDMKMTSENSLFNCEIKVEVFDVDHLAKIILKIKKIVGVLSIERLNNVTI